jgi:hypothetical protein
VKLQRSLSAVGRKQLAKNTNSIILKSEQLNWLDGQESVYENVLGAIARRRVVVLASVSLADWQVSRTKRRPNHPFGSLRSWYVAGRSSRERGPWAFNLRRIKSLVVTGEKCAIPRSWSIERHLVTKVNVLLFAHQ